MKEWILPAMVTFVAWGLWGFIPKITTRYISPQSAILYEAAAGVFVGLLVLFLPNFRLQVHPVGVTLALLTGLVGFLGAFSYLIAVSRGQVSLVVTLTALYPILSVFLAIVLLQEPITLKQGFGILLALAAMILIAT